VTQQSPFLRNALTMVGGSALAQAIPLAVVPLLSRLYSPAEFGMLATIVASSAALSVVSTARYELAVVLPKEEEEANVLVALALWLAFAVCGAVLIGTALFVAATPMRSGNGWSLAVPLLALLMAFGQIGSFIANRGRAYGRIAAASVAQQIVNSGIAIVLGISRVLAGGLVIARLAGALASCAVLCLGFRQALLGPGARSSTERKWACAKKYRQFPFFNLPYSLLGSISRDLLIFALTLKGDIIAAGLFGMARTLAMAPVTLLSGALSQLFYKETAVSIGSLEHKRLTIALLEAAAWAFVPGFALVAWWGPDMFAVLLGERWREAGVFAAVLAFPYALATLTSWPERVFESRNKQHWALLIQAVFDASTLLVVWLALTKTGSPLAAVQAYAAVQCLYHLTYLGTLCRLAELEALRYFGLLVLVAALMAAVLGLGWALSHLFIGDAARFAIHAVAVAIFSLGALGRVRRSVA